ncbi:twin-arginine translocation pathway signal protein, partial [Escherichia coli]
EFFGNPGGAVDYFTHKAGVGADLPSDLFEGEVRVDKVGYYTDLIADYGQAFLRRQSAAQPFLLSLHFTAPHWPWEGPGDEAVSRQLKN